MLKRVLLAQETLMVVTLGDGKILVAKHIDKKNDSTRCFFQRLNSFDQAANKWTVATVDDDKTLSPVRTDVYYLADNERQKNFTVVWWSIGGVKVAGPDNLSVKVGDGLNAVYLYNNTCWGYWDEKTGVYVPGLIMAKCDTVWDEEILKMEMPIIT